jgi:hypothetical protein
VILRGWELESKQNFMIYRLKKIFPGWYRRSCSKSARAISFSVLRPDNLPTTPLFRLTLHSSSSSIEDLGWRSNPSDLRMYDELSLAILRSLYFVCVVALIRYSTNSLRIPSRSPYREDSVGDRRRRRPSPWQGVLDGAFSLAQISFFYFFYQNSRGVAKMIEG